MKSSDTSANQSNIQKMLEEVGLTETEARIYLAGLSHESVTVQELLTATSIKRPTIYHALHTLGEKGLVIERDGSGFAMEAPARLLGWLNAQKNSLLQKEDAVQKLVKQLATSTLATSNSEIAHYTDMKSIQAIFDLIFYARSKECTLVLPSKDFLKELDADGTRVEDAAHRGVNVRIEIRKGISAALLQYDQNTVIIEKSPKWALTVIASPPLVSILSNLF